MDEIDRRQQSEIDAAAHVNRLQDVKDAEHDRRINRMFFLYSLVLGWLGILTLATFLSVFVQNKITITVEPRNLEQHGR